MIKRILLVLVLLSLALVVAFGQVVHTGSNRITNGRYASDTGRSWSTYGSKTNTTNLTLQSAPGAGKRVYVYQAFCVNVSASTAAVGLLKYSTTTVAAITCPPASARATPTVFDPPLQFPANVDVTLNSPGSVTTLHFFAQGTIAP